MRLSDEIMSGSFYRRHVPYVHYVDSEQGCALQLGQTGRGDINAYAPTSTTKKIHPWTEKKSACPECGITMDYANIIGNCLNDTHKWNLSKIVDYIRSVEPQENENVLDNTEQEEVEYASVT